MSSVQTPIKVDIWSDVACPWCYIGKRRFEAGTTAFLTEHPEASVEVEFHSFELSPDTPTDFDGTEIEFLAHHKGMDPAQVTQMLAQVTEIAAGEGLTYDFDALQHTNTLKAHQVLHLAKDRGVQAEAVERLLSAYFVEGRHLGRDAELADLGLDVGLDHEEVLATLAADTYAEAVQHDIAQARAYGITGVPFFVIQDKYGVSGAQEATTFSAALTQVHDETAAVAE